MKNVKVVKTNLRKIVVFVLLGILFVQNSFFNIVFAAEDQKDDIVSCKTCTMASYEFQTYVNFQVDMMQILRKAVRIKDEGKDNKNVGLFSAGILSLPANMIKAWSAAFKKGAEELADGLKAAKMGAIMLTAITSEIAGKDSGGGLLILFRNKPFVRERTTLQDLDLSLHDAMWDLGMEGIWEDEISAELMGDIIKLQQKYIKKTGNKFGLFTTFNTKGSVKYKDMVYMLLRLNGMMKTFISMDHNSPVNSKVITRGGISIGFNKVLMEKMVVSYACASGISACSSAWKDFANNTKVRKQISEGFEESMVTIDEADQSLADAYGSIVNSVGNTIKEVSGDKEKSEETGLTLKQLSILRTAYGIDTTKLSKEQGIGLESLFHGNAGKNIANSVKMKPLDYFSAEDKKAREMAAKEKARAKQDAKYRATMSFEETQKSEAEAKAKIYETPTRNEIELRSALQATLNATFMQKQDDKSLFMIYSNSALTRYFVEIGAYMHHILEVSIGTKDTKGLVKYLGDTCESQCVSKGTTNCFAK